MPPTPPSRTGWPWTEGSEQLPDTMSDGSPWPRVSIVTPSYNQAQFIEETIRSVLLQGYPNLEYIIIDGGSTDGSVEIIQKYEPWLTYWVSEPDEGQADAISKGFARAKGDVVAYLNSDDVYLPGAISCAVSHFAQDSGLALLHGDLLLVDASTSKVGKRHGKEGDFLRFFLRLSNPILQPSTFLTREALEAVGGVDAAFHFAMDYDLWCRVGLRDLKIQHVSEYLSLFRIHGRSKTRTDVLSFAQERLQMVEKYLDDPELAPKLRPYWDRLYAMADMHLAGALWLSGQKDRAHTHYRKAAKRAPLVVLSWRGMSLLVRFALGIRSFRGRFVDSID